MPKEIRLEVEKRIDAAFTGKGDTKLEYCSDQALDSAMELSFLTAVSAHSVDDKVILAFRKHHPDDTQLLGALSWASFSAARKIGSQISQ